MQCSLKKFLLVCVITHTLSSVYTGQLTAGQFAPGQPGGYPAGAPGAAGPAGGGPNGGPLISPDEFNALVAELQQYSPEELEKLERDMWNSMSPDEQAQVKKYQRQILADMGYDPDAVLGPDQAPLPGQDMQQVPQPTKPQAPTAEAKSKEATELHATPQEIMRMLSSLRHAVDQVRRMLSTSPHVPQAAVTSDIKLLDSLAWYIRMLDKKMHQDRLAQKQYQKLFHALSNFDLYIQEIVRNLGSTIHADKGQDGDNPISEAYAILNVTPQSTSEQIEEAYQQLAATYDPKAVERKLTEEGLPIADVARQVKRIKQRRILIDDAYEQLSDQALRAELDKNIAAQQSAHKEIATQFNQAVQELKELLNNAVEAQGIIMQLDNFLKEYEPEAASQKKELEKAIKSRKSEQEAARKVQATRTTGTFEPLYPSYTPPYSGARGDWRPSPTPSPAGATGQQTRPGGQAGAAAPGEKKPAEKKPETKKPEEDKKKSEAQTKKTTEKKDATLADKKKIEELFGKLGEQLKELADYLAFAEPAEYLPEVNLFKQQIEGYAKEMEATATGTAPISLPPAQENQEYKAEKISLIAHRGIKPKVDTITKTIKQLKQILDKLPKKDKEAVALKITLNWDKLAAKELIATAKSIREDAKQEKELSTKYAAVRSLGSTAMRQAVDHLVKELTSLEKELTDFQKSLPAPKLDLGLNAEEATPATAPGAPGTAGAAATPPPGTPPLIGAPAPATTAAPAT